MTSTHDYTASVTSAFTTVNNYASVETVTVKSSNNALRDLVRHARKERGLTQVEFAEAVGMSQRWVSDLEGGVIGLPRFSTLSRMSEALHVPISDLYIAGGVARTKEEADRVAESQAVLKPLILRGTTIPAEDALFEVLMLGAENLSPERQLRLLERLERAIRLRRESDEQNQGAT